ncbi:hypothetical protein ARMGADRAFT_491963 [Armillaria gallica]|uniref:Uncharacterized protein n=1 Tax=Armillaria gallica TaxID=47427 RepID=A0A2H3EIW0_ARMGA|nr:hypothetical protein ARMGADRAFT_491963 [Armillaria gallica]
MVAERSRLPVYLPYFASVSMLRQRASLTLNLLEPTLHERKRGLQDSPVNLAKMQMARTHLRALEEELRGIEETEEEIQQIMSHADALEDILGATKKLKISFSAVSATDLSNMGVERKRLAINQGALSKQLESPAVNVTSLNDLQAQLKRIYRHVSMRHKTGARMILDATLLTVAEVSVNGGAKLPVAIFPEMWVATGDGVLIKSLTTVFEICLTGTTDYGVCTYKDESMRSRILKAAVYDIMIGAMNQITMVEGKREDQELYDSMPEATSQAVALSEITGSKAVRYRLSDGRTWIFSLYVKDEQGRRVSYEGDPFTIIEPRPNAEDAFKKDIHTIAELLYHWVVSDVDPLNDPLYTLNDF